jgi:hypothetical protein
MLFKETIAVYSENHTKHINTLCGQNPELLNIKVGFKCLETHLNLKYYHGTPISETNVKSSINVTLYETLSVRGLGRHGCLFHNRSNKRVLITN